MKKIAFLICLAFIGCSKKEDAPAQYVPHVAGQWVGTGTDDAIGYYNWSVVLTQSNDTAAGTYTTSSGYGTTSGNIYLNFNGSIVTVLTMSRTGGSVCLGSATQSGSGTISSSNLTFYYTVTDCRGTNTGGANLHKIAATN